MDQATGSVEAHRDARKEYEEAWLRIIVDVVENEDKALSVIELAGINGLFEPLEEVRRLHAENEQVRSKLYQFEEMLRGHLELFDDIESFGAESICLDGFAHRARKLLESTS